MTRLRVVVHALDRTGPPMLAWSFVSWVTSERPDVQIDVVAFRGGELEESTAWPGPVAVLLDPSEPWDHSRPDEARVAVAKSRAARLPPADVTLLVGVAAGQALSYLPEPSGRVCAWVVEIGDDLHWVGDLGLVELVDQWIPGSSAAGHELSGSWGIEPAALAPEFVTRPPTPRTDTIATCRASAGADDAALLVLGAGIATRRKAPDLFLEVALACCRRDDAAYRFLWIGGERDPLFDPVRREAERHGRGAIRVLPSVPDLAPWCAAADVFLHPARLDAFPLVCLHAAAAGTPVVGFAGVGGLTEMMGPSFAGVDFPDVDGLASVLSALAQADRRRGLADAQRDRVLRRFVADVAAPSLLDQVLSFAEEAAR